MLKIFSTVFKRDPYLLAVYAVSSLMISGSITYYFLGLGNPGVLFSLFSGIVLFAFWAKFSGYNSDQPAIAARDVRAGMLPLTSAYLLLAAGCFFTVALYSTGDSLVSPWERIPVSFFALYGLSSSLLVFLLYRAENAGRRGYRLFWPLSLHLFLMLSVGSIFFLIGSGYDPFVHEAGIKHIIKFGNLEPKTFYYLGQYSLFAIIGKISSIEPWVLNKYFLPLASALLLPEALHRALRRDAKNPAATAAVILVCFPLFFLTITTPQNIAYLFVLLLVLLNADKDRRKNDLAASSLLSVACLFLQPIAGIPAAIFSFYIALDEFKKFGLGKYLVFVPAIAAVPAILFFISPAQDLRLSLGNIAILDYFSLSLPHTEGISLDLAYLLIFNLAFIFCVLAAAGAVRGLKKKSSPLLPFFLMSASLLLSYLVAESLSFDYLINYERSNYSTRLLLLSALFAVPLALEPLIYFAQKLFREEIFVKACFTLMLAVIAAGSLYSSYPRKDDYFDSKSYSIGTADIEAVRAIEADASGEPYIVLSNQQVSAAALKEYGFKSYYENRLCREGDNRILKLEGVEDYSIDCRSRFLRDIFYYPVPTGGPLYQFYLSMVYGYPKKETMKKAMEMAGVDKGYFVLNKYWWASSKVADEAKLEAKSWKDFGNGKVLVFSF